MHIISTTFNNQIKQQNIGGCSKIIKRFIDLLLCFAFVYSRRGFFVMEVLTTIKHLLARQFCSPVSAPCCLMQPWSTSSAVFFYHHGDRLLLLWHWLVLAHLDGSRLTSCFSKISIFIQFYVELNCIVSN